MRRLTSALVTPDDILTYSKSKKVKAEQDKDGGIEVTSAKFYFWFKPKNVKWNVRIEATDDPSDSDEKVTTDPVKFIAGFLGAGIPGGDHFEKMSSGPDETAGLLRHLASRIESGTLGPRRLAAMLRRAAIFPQIDLLRRVISAVARTAAGQEMSLVEVGKLQEEMKKKGWKVSEGKTDAGIPLLKVDVSGIYDATIRVESLPYEYQLNINGFPDLEEKGVTEDPISAIRSYVKSSGVEAALHQIGDTQPAPSSEGRQGIPGTENTIPVGRSEDAGHPGSEDGIRQEKTGR